MRTIVNFSIPIDKGNELARKGTIGTSLQSIIEDVKPEAVYFYGSNTGERAGTLVVDMNEGLDLPKLG